MAKIYGPLMSVDAQGQFAGNVIFRSTKNGSIATRFHSPGSVNPSSPSAAQLANRALYGAAVAAWRALTVPQQTAFDVLGAPESLSGWNYFLREQMLNPSSIVTDDFTRPNENPILSPWNISGAFNPMRILSNKVFNSTGTPSNSACVYDSVFSSDQFCEMTIGDIATANDMGVLSRFDFLGNGYAFLTYTPNPGIYELSGGIFTILTSTSLPGLIAGDRLKISCVGNVLEAFVNGASVGSVVDNTYSSGSVGGLIYEPDGSFSYFEAGDI